MIAQFFAISLTLFFVIDVLGVLPTYLSLVKPYSQKEQKRIAIRELFVALAIMIAFHYVGQILLTLLKLDPISVKLSGGIVLFLISIRLIFSETISSKWITRKPFVVPIATPLIAGPSVLAIIMIFAEEHSTDWMVIGPTIVAWFFSGIILLLAHPITSLFKEKGLLAARRLMGLIVALISVQFFIDALKELLA